MGVTAYQNPRVSSVFMAKRFASVKISRPHAKLSRLALNYGSWLGAQQGERKKKTSAYVSFR